MSNDEPEPGKCNAHPTQDGGYCARYPSKGRDRCSSHGGESPQGMNSPNAIHGLRSPHLSEEDEEIYDEVREHSNVELLQEEFWMVKTKLLRAARATEGNEGVGMAQDLLDKIEDGEADEEVVDALAKLLQVSETAVDRAIGRLIDLSKRIHKETEGETVNLDHSGQIDSERSLSDDDREAALALIRQRNSEPEASTDTDE